MSKAQGTTRKPKGQPPKPKAPAAKGKSKAAASAKASPKPKPKAGPKPKANKPATAKPRANTGDKPESARWVGPLALPKPAATLALPAPEPKPEANSFGLPAAACRPGLKVIVNRQALRRLLTGIDAGGRGHADLGRDPEKFKAIVLHAASNEDVYLRAFWNSDEPGLRLRFGGELVGVGHPGAAAVPLKVLRGILEKSTKDQVSIAAYPPPRDTLETLPIVRIECGMARWEMRQDCWRFHDRISGPDIEEPKRHTPPKRKPVELFVRPTPAPPAPPIVRAAPVAPVAPPRLKAPGPIARTGDLKADLLAAVRASLKPEVRSAPKPDRATLTGDELTDRRRAAARQAVLTRKARNAARPIEEVLEKRRLSNLKAVATRRARFAEAGAVATI